MDPNEHEHPEGFPEHNHPHDTTYHMDFSGLTGKGQPSGHAELDVPGAQSAIIGEPPKGPAGAAAQGEQQGYGDRKNTFTFNQTELDKVKKAISLVLAFHELRDGMNAHIHEESVRWSPLTKTLQEAFKVLAKTEGE